MTDSKELPVLPVRNAVVFPGNVMPLTIGREKSVELVKELEQSTTKEIAVFTQKDEKVDHPDEDDIHQVGCLVEVVRILDTSTSQHPGDRKLYVRGKERVSLKGMTKTTPYFEGVVDVEPTVFEDDSEEKALFNQLKERAEEASEEMSEVPKQTPQMLEKYQDDPEGMADFLASNIANLTIEEKQEFLEELSLKDRLEMVLDRINEHQKISEIEEDLLKKVEEKSQEEQKKYYAKKKIEALQEEIGEGDDVAELETRLEEMKLPERVESAAEKQINRLKNMQPSSSEYSVALNYVETLLDIPWYSKTDDSLDMERARETLENDHYGLEDVKERIIEELAVQDLKTDKVSPIICLVGPPGVGKAQPLDANILTPEGWTTMGEIEPGDEVIGEDGEPKEVVETFPQGEKQIYRVEFSDGSSTECCGEHLWKTQTRQDRLSGREGSVKETEDIMNTLTCGSDNRRNHSIPTTDPVEMEEKDLPLDPYLLGAFLGDGCFRDRGDVKFSNGDSDVINRVSQNLPDGVYLWSDGGYDFRITRGEDPPHDENGYMVKNSLQEKVIDFDLDDLRSHEKSIPDEYKHGSVKQRLKLLRGLMDTDGSIKDNGVSRFSSSSETLIEDLKFIVHSLGGKTRLSSRFENDDEKRVNYRLAVALPVNPFWCNRKADRYDEPEDRYTERRYIDSIEPIGKKEAKCILVDSESSLYLTDDCIVTHNTSLGKSVARTMGRKFRRISLGGMYDESEIRGHRRTYVGAMPGKIVRGIQKTGVMNPVIMLDEIDKIGNDFRGDPEAALLEVLDPEQNDEFEDHYVETHMDLSDVFFLTTANYMEGISEPLKDRMEIIQVPSYTNYEKKQIGKKFLLPKQLEEKGVTEDNVDITDESFDLLIERYTQEAGVRSLERRIGDVCRKVAAKVATQSEEDRESFHTEVTPDWIREELGKEEYQPILSQRSTTTGVATGMAYTGAGGDVLFVETQKMPGDGEVKFTGSLGDVMEESVEAALSYIQAEHERYGLSDDFMEGIKLHTHFPAGAVPKDGPSAGITIFSSILSILEDEPLREDVSMTGEITLRGDILPVGGIKEKVTAAHRAGIKEIILPEQCEKDLEDVSESVKEDLTFHFVNHVDQVPKLVFETSEKWSGFPLMESDDEVEPEA